MDIQILPPLTLSSNDNPITFSIAMTCGMVKGSCNVTDPDHFLDGDVIVFNQSLTLCARSPSGGGCAKNIELRRPSVILHVNGITVYEITTG